MAVEPFFAQYPVFRYEELRHYLNQNGYYKETSIKALMQYHLSKGHIERIRRGYYAVISARSMNAFDSLLIAGRVSQDSIIAYHSALDFYGIAYSLLTSAFFVSKVPMQPFEFQQTTYQRIMPVKALLPNNLFYETKVHDRQGLDICVTTIERTLVDCLAKPQFAHGFEEIWHAASMINFLDVERMVRYVFKLGNATTVAKLGFFLEQHQTQFSVAEKLLSKLEKNIPKGIHHMQRSADQNQYARRWNLMVPFAVKNKAWEEPNHDI